MICAKQWHLIGLPKDGDSGYQVRDHVVDCPHEVLGPQVDQAPLEPVSGPPDCPLEVLGLLAHPLHARVDGPAWCGDDVVQGWDSQLRQLQVPEGPDDRRRRRCVQERQHDDNQCAQCKLHFVCVFVCGWTEDTRLFSPSIESIEFLCADHLNDTSRKHKHYASLHLTFCELF